MNGLVESITDIFKATGLTLLVIVIAGGIIGVFILFVAKIAEPSPEHRAAQRVPVAISEAGGCTVYRFVDSGTHYFTRCGDKVTTTKNYTENCGKACTRQRQEVITTEGNK